MTFRHSWRRVLAATAVITGAVLAVPTAAHANPVQGIGLTGGPSCTPDYVKAGWQLTNTNAIPATVMQVDAGPVELSGIAVGSVIPAAVDGQPGTLTGTQEFSPAYDGPFTLSVTVNVGVQFPVLTLSYTIDDECQPDYGPGGPTTPPTQGPPTGGPTTAPPTPEPTATQPPATPSPVPTTPAAGPSLPVTGGDPLPIVAAGLALLAGGALLALVIARRRRSRFVS